MTELYIDGVSVVLPSNFSVSVKRENPFFTKNGEYTYDVTLKLDNPTNCALYAHINRLNAGSLPKGDRSAVLIADNRVYCRGTEIVTSWSDTEVSIQLAGGNSELNYFLGYEELISTLEMKRTEVSKTKDEEEMKVMAKYAYPAQEYCLATVYNRTAKSFLNNWYIEWIWDSTQGDEYPDGHEEFYLSDKRYAMPFLCAYLKELFRAMGYNLDTNQLEGTPYAQLYIVHVEEVSDWAKMLPGVTIKELLEGVERLFNMAFIIDSKTQAVKLLFRNAYFAGASTAHVLQVKDSYEAEIEEPEEEENATSNLTFDVASNEYWKWHALENHVLGAAVRKNIPYSHSSSQDAQVRLRNWFASSDNQRMDVLWFDEFTSREIIYQGSEGGTPKFRVANDFADVKREEAVNTVEIGIHPVEFYTHRWFSESMTPQAAYIPALESSSSASDDDSEERPILGDLITEGGESDSESGNGVAIAFHSPKVGNYFDLPYSYIDTYTIDEEGRMLTTNSVNASLRLQVLNELYYQGVYDIKHDQAIQLESYDPNLYDVRIIFELNNKRYVCKDIEYTLDALGRKGPWKGTFYPISLSDVEADARWILADGKWRDAGVWMDNGRWLDE